MDKELINRAWASLPAEFRSKIRERFAHCLKEQLNIRVDELKHLFGNNLTSDAEPEPKGTTPGQPNFRKGDVVKWHDLPDIYIVEECFNSYKIRNANGISYTFAKECDLALYTDSKQPKPKPKFDIGDGVQVCNIKKYDGKVYAILDRRYSEQGWVYEINIHKWFNEAWLTPVTAPEQPQPRFKVGNKVFAKNMNRILTIRRILPDSQKYEMEEGSYWPWDSPNLQPYTAPTDKAEEKKLDLYELLKGHEGEEIFSVTDDVVTITKVTSDEIKLHGHNTTIIVGGNMMYRSGICVIYPTKELYEQYPLDAPKAWQVWADEQKPKRWRAKNSDKATLDEVRANEDDYVYWFITDSLTVAQDEEVGCRTDNMRYDANNYFRTNEDAEYAAQEMRKCLERVHNELNNEKI